MRKKICAPRNTIPARASTCIGALLCPPARARRHGPASVPPDAGLFLSVRVCAWEMPMLADGYDPKSRPGCAAGERSSVRCRVEHSGVQEPTASRIAAVARKSALRTVGIWARRIFLDLAAAPLIALTIKAAIGVSRNCRSPVLRQDRARKLLSFRKAIRQKPRALQSARGVRRPALPVHPWSRREYRRRSGGFEVVR
jgi:hypothetical protein